MHFTRLTSADDALFAQAFAVYETSFPLHEQRTLDKQQAIMARPAYYFDAIVEEGEFAGILLWWRFDGYAYVEHFAINTAFRGKSLGSRSLELFCADKALVILEIDPPVDPVSIRRESFYTRLGFCVNPYPHAHPSYRRQFPPHDLVVMSHDRPLEPEEYDAFSDDLAHRVMADAEV
ncbi:MAG: GNAT family N-acetyltransferase [Planctomycetaceae bacterium]|nr:GNAT family N-acetyltransferase [Planctomycetaceae bacterium]